MCLSYVVHGPIYGRFMGFYLNGKPLTVTVTVDCRCSLLSLLLLLLQLLLQLLSQPLLLSFKLSLVAINNPIQGYTHPDYHISPYLRKKMIIIHYNSK